MLYIFNYSLKYFPVQAPFQEACVDDLQSASCLLQQLKHTRSDLNCSVYVFHRNFRKSSFVPPLLSHYLACRNFGEAAEAQSRKLPFGGTMSATVPLEWEHYSQ